MSRIEFILVDRRDAANLPSSGTGRSSFIGGVIANDRASFRFGASLFLYPFSKVGHDVPDTPANANVGNFMTVRQRPKFSGTDGQQCGRLFGS